MNTSRYLHSPLVKSIYKRAGITPLQAIQEYKSTYPELQDEKVSYAGRLDPMADGVLILLIGDANKVRNEFLHLEKEYRVEILFGFATDSFDVLGMPKDVSVKRIDESVLRDCIGSFKGRILQKFPPYSSKPVQGKPLYYWARQNLLDTIEIPMKEREIYDIKVVSLRSEKGDRIIEDIVARVGEVQGDFRQDEIISAWSELLPIYATHEFVVVTIDVAGSSGLYMRQLCVDIGEKINMHALAYKITRTRVGDFTIGERLP